MRASTLRKIFARRPYRPLEITLDNGDRFLVTHPEAILIVEQLVAIALPGEELMELISPEAISSVGPARPKNARRAGRKPT
ncbi:MAG: hypothetical protein HY720_25085 [Planctomycetes bacterium]|nr:hypothetical protein [Planctomycetota bacterium]